MLQQIFRADLSKNLFRLALWGAGLASISMMIWTVGPLINIGGYRPLSNAAGPPSQSFAGGNGRPLPAMQGNFPDIPLFSLQ